MANFKFMRKKSLQKLHYQKNVLHVKFTFLQYIFFCNDTFVIFTLFTLLIYIFYIIYKIQLHYLDYLQKKITLFTLLSLSIKVSIFSSGLQCY